MIGVLDDWKPMPKFYDLNNGRLDEAEDVFIPYSRGELLEVVSAGNTNCWKTGAHQDVPATSSTPSASGFRPGSSCDHPTRSQPSRRSSTTTSREQKKLGRFQRPLNNRLSKVERVAAAQRGRRERQQRAARHRVHVPGGLPAEHRGPAAREVLRQGRRRQPAPRARREPQAGSSASTSWRSA